MLVSNVVLHVELLLAELAAVGALEARRFTAVVLEVGRYRALRRVTLPTTRAREPRLQFSWTSLQRLVLQPWQRQHL